MAKVYTINKITTVQNDQKSPRESVVNALLNFSKSIEVLKSSKEMEKQVTDQVELILN